MIRVPITIVVAQWSLLLGFSVFLVVLYRQLAHLMRVSRATTDEGGLALGTAAPSFHYVQHGTGEERGFEATGIPSLLLFADPGCTSCEAAISALERVARGENARTRIVIATNATPQVINAIAAFRETPVEIARVEREVPYLSYQTLVTPFFFAIDQDGVIRAKGSTTSPREIRSLIRAARAADPRKWEAPELATEEEERYERATA